MPYGKITRSRNPSIAKKMETLKGKGRGRTLPAKVAKPIKGNAKRGRTK